MHDLIQQFQAYLLTQKRVARNTMSAYSHDLAQFNDYLMSYNINLFFITEEQLHRFVQYMRGNFFLSARTLARKISSIKALFTYLHEQHGFAELATTLQFPKLEKRLPQFLTVQEIEQLLTYAQQQTNLIGKRNHLLITLLYVTGMRISEAVSLKISGIRFDTGFLTVYGKGGKERLIPLPQSVVPVLQLFLTTIHPKFTAGQSTDLLFSVVYRKTIKALTRQAAWVIVKKLAKQAGIERNFSPHTLRHSLATHLLENGANLRSLQMLLGHEHLSTTEIYTHINTSHLRKIYDKKHPRS